MVESDTTSIKTSEFALQKIYAVVSSEVPHVPEVFEINEAPHLDVKLNIASKVSSKVGNHIVELIVVVTAQYKEKTLFLVEVKQGGIFTIKGVDESMLSQVINIQCPTLLYPYASARVAELILQAGFMPYHLPPVDFHALYLQQNNS